MIEKAIINEAVEKTLADGDKIIKDMEADIAERQKILDKIKRTQKALRDIYGL